jgi:AhpD family alkylhydroperoxidase
MSVRRILGRRFAFAAACVVTIAAGAAFVPRAAVSDDTASPLDATYKDIMQTMGKVPAFIQAFPKAGLPGAWAEVKALELSNDTALPPKVKALISLAVAAQIPCQYCIWADTRDAREAGATDQEIQEAVALSALTRHWSTIFNGMQVDFETFKKDYGGAAPQ